MFKKLLKITKYNFSLSNIKVQKFKLLCSDIRRANWKNMRGFNGGNLLAPQGYKACQTTY